MKMHVVILDWAVDDERGVKIIAVMPTIELAIDAVELARKEEVKLAEKKGWTVFRDEKTMFEAGEEGQYNSNHTYVYVEEVTVGDISTSENVYTAEEAKKCILEGL